MRDVTLIAAMDEARGIGRDNQLICRRKEDMAFFKRQTMNGVCIMGRKTFESLPKPLDGRLNIVVTRSRTYNVPAENVYVFNSVIQALDFARRESVVEKYPAGTFVIGGGEIYKKTLPFASRLLLTHVKGTYGADTFFPVYEPMFTSGELLARHDGFYMQEYLREGVQ